MILQEDPGFKWWDGTSNQRSDDDWTFEKLLEHHLSRIRVQAMAAGLARFLGYDRYKPGTDRCPGCHAIYGPTEPIDGGCDECVAGNGPPTVPLVERVWAELTKMGLGDDPDLPDPPDLPDLATTTHQFTEAAS